MLVEVSEHDLVIFNREVLAKLLGKAPVGFAVEEHEGVPAHLVSGIYVRPVEACRMAVVDAVRIVELGEDEAWGHFRGVEAFVDVAGHFRIVVYPGP